MTSFAYSAAQRAAIDSTVRYVRERLSGSHIIWKNDSQLIWSVSLIAQIPAIRPIGSVTLDMQGDHIRSWSAHADAELYEAMDNTNTQPRREQACALYQAFDMLSRTLTALELITVPALAHALLCTVADKLRSCNFRLDMNVEGSQLELRHRRTTIAEKIVPIGALILDTSGDGWKIRFRQSFRDDDELSRPETECLGEALVEAAGVQRLIAQLIMEQGKG